MLGSVHAVPTNSGTPHAANTHIHLPSPKPGHTTGGSGRGGARQGGRAERGQAARDADCESMLNFALALAFNGCFASGAGIHPWVATGRAWAGAPEARIGHTHFHLLTRSLPVSGNPELNGRLTGKRVWRNYAPNHYLWTPLHAERGSPDPGVHFRFGRVSVRNSPFEIFPRNLRSVSRNSHGWVLRALWFTLPRVMSSNVISALSYLMFCGNFLGPSISYPRRRLAIFPREWLHSFLRRKSYVENFALSYVLFSEETFDANSF